MINALISHKLNKINNSKFTTSSDIIYFFIEHLYKISSSHVGFPRTLLNNL